MKKSFVYSLSAFLLAFVFVFSTAAQTRSETANRQLEAWKTFSPAGKYFKVALPAEPQQLDDYGTQAVVASLSSQMKKSSAELETAMFNNVSVYNLDARWNGFGIVVIDYKWQKIEYDAQTGVVTLSNETKTDETVLSEWLEFEKAKMLSNGIFTSETTMVKDGKSFKARAFATKNRVYLLFVGMPDLSSATPALAGVYQAEADKFFNSFQILDNKPQVARGAAAKSETKSKN